MTTQTTRVWQIEHQPQPQARSQQPKPTVRTSPIPTMQHTLGNQAMRQVIEREVRFTDTILPARVVRGPGHTSPPAGGVRSGEGDRMPQLTAPPSAAPPSASGSPAPAAQYACVESLMMNSSGPIEGKFGINQYWTGVTPYWGSSTTLGKFDIAGSGGWHTLGHKFQVVGTFSRGSAAGVAAGNATFQQRARLTVGTSASSATAGAWFDDMDYVDAGGGAHQWDPNAEAGTTARAGYPGVRRTIASNKYAYTDPPAISYQPGATNTYRKLEFEISFRSSPGAPCSFYSISMPRVQEIEVTNGVPKVIKFPYP